jgi:hypothetical protein
MTDYANTRARIIAEGVKGALVCIKGNKLFSRHRRAETKPEFHPLLVGIMDFPDMDLEFSSRFAEKECACAIHRFALRVTKSVLLRTTCVKFLSEEISLARYPRTDRRHGGILNLEIYKLPFRVEVMCSRDAIVSEKAPCACTDSQRELMIIFLLVLFHHIYYINHV